MPPNERPDPIEEPHEQEKNLQPVDETFQSSWASYLDDLRNFETILGEGMLELAIRFDGVALPVLNAGLITERDLAPVLRKRIPLFFRAKVFHKMNNQDE